MMRRGTLADHRVASVLRQAAAERLSGQIDIDGDRAAVVYLADGELSLACWADDDVDIAVDDDSDDATYSAAILTEERRLRAASRDVLGLLLDRDEGWYHHHPLGEHRAAALWSWPVEELLAEVAVRAHRPTSSDPGEDPARAAIAPTDAAPPTPAPATEPAAMRDGAPPGTAPDPPDAPRARVESLAARRLPLPGASATSEPRPPIPGEVPAPARTPVPGEVPAPAPAPVPVPAPAPADEAEAPTGPAWRLAATPPTEPLDDAAWTVLVALAGTASESEIVDRLGWPAVKAEIVLRSLEARGVVVAASREALEGPLHRA